MVIPLLEAELAGKIAHLGFDTSEMYLDALRYKRVGGLVMQDSFRMGESGAKKLAKYLLGSRSQNGSMSGAVLATPDNIAAVGNAEATKARKCCVKGRESRWYGARVV
jgi:ABC-type sugar transport system substrate-binding protein